MSLDCLKNIIALSLTTCECYDEGKPADYNTTTSGYVLDELEGVDLRVSECATDCSTGSLWDLMDKSREIACKDFETELLAFIQSESRLTRKPFKGFIGERSWNSTLPILDTYHGLRISACPEIRGGYIFIKGITTFMNKTKTAIPIQIWNNVDSEPLFEFDIQSEERKPKDNDVLSEVIKLPLWNEKCAADELEYYIVYEPNDFAPLNNVTRCNCKGKRFGWEDYIDVDGVHGSDTSELDDFTAEERRYNNGLCLSIETGCELDNIICDNISCISPSPIHRVIGKTIQYRAGEVLIEKILESGDVNRYTLLENERLWGKRNHFRKEYQSRIAWLAEEIDISESDCLSCGSDKVIMKRTIRS